MAKSGVVVMGTVVVSQHRCQEGNYSRWVLGRIEQVHDDGLTSAQALFHCSAEKQHEARFLACRSSRLYNYLNAQTPHL